MSKHAPTSVILSDGENTITGFCLYCGRSMRLSSPFQKFCSNNCKDSFNEKLADLRRRRRNEYQKQFRTASYKTKVKHVEKVVCPKCQQQGYLVRYSVRSMKTGRTVSVYETVRHQITQQGKSILKSQCYIKSIPRGANTEPSPDIKREAHRSFDG